MSIEENKLLVQRYQELYNQNNLDGLGEVLAEDLAMPTRMPGLPAGLEGARAAHRIMLLAFPDFQTVIEDLIAEDDKVAARIRMTGTQRGEFMGIPPTGRRVEFTGIYIVRIQDGMIVEHWGQEDVASLMEQLRTLKIVVPHAEPGAA
jgi:steroid delta-isomerase-like uncharacterized protein